MTIITKLKAIKKSENNLEKPLVISDNICQNVEGPVQRDSTNQQDMELWFSPSIRRRISATTTVCVFITALLVMSMCIIGGVYLYRQVTHHQKAFGFRGWCGIPYEKNSLHFSVRDRLGPNKPFFKNQNEAEWMPKSKGLFKQQFELDLDTDMYERIDVPDFGYGRRGQFIHDFKMNKTLIVDWSEKRCYIMPLDREHVKPPKSMFDLIGKLWMGYYNIDTSVVRRQMRVVTPALSNLEGQGMYIERNCVNFMTYLLEDRPELRIRRAASDTSVADKEKTITVAEFAGKNIIEYTITE